MYMIPIDCKIANFFLYLFVSFLKIAVIISWRAPSYKLVENPLDGMFNHWSACLIYRF